MTELNENTGGSSDRLSAQTILVVDDDSVILCLVEEILTAEGYAVILAEGGEQAVAQAVATLPDLIMMDLGLPGMSGHEAMEILRRNPHTRNIPIIVMSGLPVDVEEMRERFPAFREYIAKPLSVQQVRRTVRNALQPR